MTNDQCPRNDQIPNQKKRTAEIAEIAQRLTCFSPSLRFSAVSRRSWRLYFSFLGAFNLVGELIYIIRAPGEMLREDFAGRRDAVDDSVGELALFEAAGHLIGDFLPELLAAFGVDAFVAEDGEVARFGGDENQHAVAIFGVGHLHALELELCAGDRIGRLGIGNEDTNLAGGFCLGGLDGGDNFGVFEGVEKRFWNHGDVSNGLRHWIKT